MNFVISWVEHEKFYNLEARADLTCSVHTFLFTMLILNVSYLKIWFPTSGILAGVLEKQNI